MGEGGNTPILEGVFPPEEPLFVTSPSYLQGISEGPDGTERVQHQVHLAPDPFANGMNGSNMPFDGSILPKVEF
jgi:hypothetical protein